MKNKKIFSFKKMTSIGKIGIGFAASFAILTIFMATWWEIVVGLARDWIILSGRQKFAIISLLIIFQIYQIFNLVMIILFVKNKLNSRTLIGILSLFPFIFPGVFILLGEGEVEEESNTNEK